MSDALELRLAGDHAYLVQLSDNAQVHHLARAVRAMWPDQLAEVVPGHTTLLLVWHRERPSMDTVGASLKPIVIGDDPEASDTAPPVCIPTHYDGADLVNVATKLGVTVDEVVRLHSERVWTVAFMGFAPGFPYLIGGDPRLALPRLSTPRTAVPAGSVAVAAGYCGIYPRSSPGGWNLLGRTELVLFDAERDPPALLAPGARVRFEPL